MELAPFSTDATGRRELHYEPAIKTSVLDSGGGGVGGVQRRKAWRKEEGMGEEREQLEWKQECRGG